MLTDVRQAEIAKKINLSQEAISRVEKGHFNLTKDKIEIISHIFNCNSDWLHRGSLPVFSQSIVFKDLSPLNVFRKSEIEIDKVLRTLFISFLKENNVTELGIASLSFDHNLCLFKIQNNTLAVKIIGDLNHSMLYAISEVDITKEKRISLSNYEFLEIEKINNKVLDDVIKKVEQATYTEITLSESTHKTLLAGHAITKENELVKKLTIVMEKGNLKQRAEIRRKRYF